MAGLPSKYAQHGVILSTAKGLLKKGLLQKWNGKKVKRKDLPELLKDPDFKVAAANALYRDNKEVLKSAAEKNGITLSEDKLDELAIDAHNRGVSKTMKDMLKGETPNKKPSNSTFTYDKGVDTEGMDLSGLESIAKDLGHKNLRISSARRSLNTTEKLADQMIAQYLPNIKAETEEQKKALRTLALRGNSPDSIRFPSGNWLPEATKYAKKYFPNQWKDVISGLQGTGSSLEEQKETGLRWNFGGYESGHVAGKKVDVPYSTFIDQYGPVVGKQKAKEFIEELKKHGYKIVDEEKNRLSRNGVIDINLDYAKSPASGRDMVEEESPDVIKARKMAGIKKSVDSSNLGPIPQETPEDFVSKEIVNKDTFDTLRLGPEDNEMSNEMMINQMNEQRKLGPVQGGPNELSSPEEFIADEITNKDTFDTMRFGPEDNEMTNEMMINQMNEERNKPDLAAQQEDAIRRIRQDLAISKLKEDMMSQGRTPEYADGGIADELVPNMDNPMNPEWNMEEEARKEEERRAEQQRALAAAAEQNAMPEAPEGETIEEEIARESGQLIDEVESEGLQAPNAAAPSEETPVTEDGMTPTEANVAKEINADDQDKLAMESARKASQQDPKVKNIYDSILQEYNDAIASRDAAKKKQAKIKILNALMQFGQQYGAAKAQEASGLQVDAYKSNLETPKVEDLMTGQTPQDVLRKYKMLKDAKTGGMTEYQQQALKYRQAEIELKKSIEGRRKEGFSYKKIQKQQDDARSAIKDMRATETWKSADKTLSTIPELELLLEDSYRKGGQSLAMLGPKVAKGIAGEVGVLTEKDVTRYVENPKLAAKLLDVKEKFLAGKLTEVSYENLKRLLEISKKAAKGKQKSALEREAMLFAKREDIPLEEAMYLLDSTSMKQKAEKEMEEEKKKMAEENDMVRVQAPNGATGMIPRANLKKALEKGYKEIK